MNLNKSLFIFLTFYLTCFVNHVFGINYSGVYAYNKGMNKASGVIYISHFKEDSAFFMMQAVSGMPDFLTSDIKGFIHIDSNNNIFKLNDTCQIQFAFTSTNCIVKQIGNCPYEYSCDGKYKKNIATAKKTITLLPAFADKKGLVKIDSLRMSTVPHIHGYKNEYLRKNEPINITDEYNGFYLIELKNKKNEFLWVSKKGIQLLKNK